jgi:hypothetical protein
MSYYSVPKSGIFFLFLYYINTVGDADWVCLAPHRKVLKVPLNMVMTL